MNDCPNCEYHRQRAQRWREEVYKLSGHPLPEREQKPVAWMYVGTHVTKPIHTDEVDYEQIANDDEWFPVYLQPKRTWVGLTDKEIDQICGDVGYGYIDVARAIEAKLKEKQ